MTSRSWKVLLDRRALPSFQALRIDRQRNRLENWEQCEPRTLLTGGGSELAIDHVSVTEPVSGNTKAVFTVSLASPSSQPVTVDYSTSDAGAQAGVDYQATSGTLTFAPGEVTETVSVPVLGGQAPKSNDTFSVTLSNPSGASLDSDASVGIGTILPTSSLSIDDVSIVEGTDGTTNADFTVTLDSPKIDEPVTVDYTTQDGTAKAGTDYEAVNGTLTFQPDQTTQTISVPIINGTSYKPTEMFSVNLSNPANAVIAAGQGTGTIIDNSTPGTLQLSEPDATVDPVSGLATITVTRSNGNASDVGVSYATSGGTAVPGVDYTPVSGTLNFAANQTSQSFTVPVLSNLLLGENKTVGITLSQPTGGGALGLQSSATLTIANPNTLVVTNTNDSGPGSLRQAILTADANPPGKTITFDVPGTGPFTIAPTSALPAITVPVTIDATTEPGYQGTPLIELDGENAGSQVNGLAITAGNTTVKGLAINRFGGSGILLQGEGGNRILGNEIGVNPSGDTALGNAFDGIAINESSNNLIGGHDVSERNVISSNGIKGIQITGSTSHGNIIEGNYIGTDRLGQKDLGNADGGIYLYQVSGNIIGGSSLDSANLISGNDGSGVQITGASSTQNVIQGNRIGIDATGESSLGNARDGIDLEGAAGNIIGGTGIHQGNLISDNQLTGIRISGLSASGNQIQGNRIGTDQAGSGALGNRFDGVFVNGAPGNIIGGIEPGAGNQISGNGGVGVQIYSAGASGNQVQGNLIGTDATGLKAVANDHDGVYLNAASNNLVGGTAAGSRNVISGNGFVGVQLSPQGANGNVIQGNWIGADVDGRPRLGNDFGIDLAGTTRNTVGGMGPAANVIAGNRQANVLGGSAIDKRTAPVSSRQVTTAPKIERAQLNTNGSQLTSVTLTFSASLDGSRAQDISNYRLRLAGPAGGFGNRSSVSIPLVSATYDAKSDAVTLQLVTPLSLGVPFQLQVNGKPGRGLTDTLGRYLDGQPNGGGRDYVVVLNNASISNQDLSGA